MMTPNSQPPKPDSRPNIVMVLTDQHAARVLGAAGDSLARTPALDALAAQGVRFDACYCPAPLCVPSRMAFLTGLEPHVSGVLGNDDYLPSDLPTLAHALGAAGYDCHLVGRMHFYGPDQEHGFQRPLGDIGPNWPAAGPPDIGPLTKGSGNRGPELEFSGAGETSYQAFDHAVTAEALRLLPRLFRQRDETGRPFFCIVSLFCPHPPYIARRADYDAFAGRLPPPRLPPPDRDPPAIAAWRAAGKVAEVSAEAVAASRAAYYGLVRMIDRLAGQVLDLAGGRDDTVSIYASDHGEALGERGLWWKSTLYDDSAKVPLIIRGPGFAPGTVDRRAASLLDLSATILSLGGACLPEHSGHDLRATNRPARATSSYYGGLMNIAVAPLRHRMLRRDDWKLIWFDDAAPPLLFDLSQDPDELADRADDPALAGLRADMTQALLDGWDATQIARLQQRNAARAAIIRAWVKATRPPEPHRWIDPAPGRNRYE